jgi:hypothetical protein
VSANPAAIESPVGLLTKDCPLWQVLLPEQLFVGMGGVTFVFVFGFVNIGAISVQKSRHAPRTPLHNAGAVAAAAATGNVIVRGNAVTFGSIVAPSMAWMPLELVGSDGELIES